jgi:hypothetical protein
MGQNAGRTPFVSMRCSDAVSHLQPQQKAWWHFRRAFVLNLLVLWVCLPCLLNKLLLALVWNRCFVNVSSRK